MKPIFALVSDPGWWFSAVVIAIFASVIAGFVKDYLALLISKTSTALAQRRQKQPAKRQIVIEAMVTDERYMVYMMFLALICMLASIALIVVFLGSPVLLTFLPEPDLAIKQSNSAIAWRLLAPVVGILANIAAYSTSSRLAVIYAAIREYCKRRGLPKSL